MTGKRWVLWTQLPFVIVFGLVVVAAAVRRRSDRQPDLKRSEPVVPSADATKQVFHAKNYRSKLEHLREDMKSDPTLAGALQEMSLDTVMQMENLSPAERVELWNHLEKLKAEAKKHPRQSAYEVIDE